MSDPVCPAHPVPAPVSRCPVPGHVSAGLVRDYDYRADPRIAHNFWSVAADMADQPEIFWTTAQGGHWVVTSAEAMEAVTLRPDLFSSRVGSIPSAAEPPRLIPASLDPPEHGAYRKVMAQRMFSVRALADLEAQADAVCSAILEEFAGAGSCEFVSAFARRVPVDLFLTMMGAPPERRDAFLAWVEKVFRPASVAQLGEGFAEADAFTSDWLDTQFTDGTNRGQLFVAMTEATIDGRPLTRAEMHSMTMMLFLGGLDTVVSQLTHIAGFLAANPAHRDRLVREHERIPAAMEELLRRFGITHFVREVAQDCAFRGLDFRKGELMLLATPFANLDRRVFDDPLAVDFDRDTRLRHWGFGHGIHLCVGAHLARVQVRTAMTQILARLPGLRMAENARPEIQSGGTIVIRSLSVEWEPASR